MNLIEAIKSGKNYRRRGRHNVWMTSIDEDELRQDENCEATFLRDCCGNRISLMVHDITAEDWELQEPAVTITRTHLDEAIMSAVDFLHLYQPSQKPPVGEEVPTWRHFAAVLAMRIGL